jgi:hypothetical protein
VARKLAHVGAFAVGILLAALGIGLCFTVVGIPLGVPLIIISGTPLAWMMRHYNKQDMIDAELKVLTDTTSGPKPWFDEED